MLEHNGTGERCAALFVLAATAFSPLVLSIFQIRESLFGIPVSYLYLFIAWGVVIALLARTAERAASSEEKADEGHLLDQTADF